MKNHAKNAEVHGHFRSYRRTVLLQIFRNYSRAMDWNTHPMMLQRRVDLWISTGQGPIDKAIEYHETQQRRRVRLRERIMFGTVSSLAIFAFCLVWWTW